MSDTVLKIGMPAARWLTPTGRQPDKLLEQAGFKVAGYDTGGPSRFTTVNYLYGWDGRPQEFATQLAVGELDVAIAGDDWIRERVLELRYEYGKEVDLRRAMSLSAGACAWWGSFAPTRNTMGCAASSPIWPAASP